MSEFLSVPQTAKRWGVTPSSVYRWIAEGRLPAWRVGDTIRIDRDVVENFAQPIVVGAK